MSKGLLDVGESPISSVGLVARLLTLPATCAYLCLSPSTVKRLTRRRILKSLKVGKARRWDRWALDRWIEASQKEGNGIFMNPLARSA